jgi:Protein kinase domain
MIGETVSHYRVLRRLGAGGMGEVYEAEDSRLDRRGALKFLSDALNNDAQALERFQREAWATSSLNHPNICTIYEIGEFSGRAYIAMQSWKGKRCANISPENHSIWSRRLRWHCRFPTLSMLLIEYVSRAVRARLVDRFGAERCFADCARHQLARDLRIRCAVALIPPKPVA